METQYNEKAHKCIDKRQLYILLALLSVYVFWGGTYLGMRIAIETLPPFLMAGTRFLTAGILLYAFARFTGAERPKWLHWKETGVIGGLLLLGGNGVVAWAEQMVPSGIAALLIATVPLWVLVLNWAGPNRARPSTGVIAGILLGLAGIAVLVFQPGMPGEAKALHPLGIGALLFAALSWSVGSLYSRRAALPSSALLSTAMQMLVGGAFLIPVSFFLGEWSRINPFHVSTRSLFALGYLIFFGSIVGYNAYIWLLKNAEPSWVSTYAFVNPVVAVVLGWAFAGEQLTLNSYLAAVIIIAAVVIITFFRNLGNISTKRTEKIVDTE